MRVAIVGSGISGLTALWVLKKYSDHEVNIYETADRVGGQAAGVQPGGKSAPYSPIIAHGRDSDHLVQLLDELDIPRADVDLSLRLTDDESAPLLDLLSPQAWRYALDVARFRTSAATSLAAYASTDGSEQITLQAFLKAEGYAAPMFDRYLLPHIALLFLTPDDASALALPAEAVITRLTTEGVLSSSQKHFTIDGGARHLADQLAAVVPPENLHLNAEIVSISSEDGGVRLVEANGHHHIYEHVVLAVPAPAARTLLQRGGWVSDEEEKGFAALNWISVGTSGAVANGVAHDSIPAVGVSLAPDDEGRRLVSLAINLPPTPSTTINPPSPTEHWTHPLPIPLPSTTTPSPSPLLLNQPSQPRNITHIGHAPTLDRAIASALRATTAPPFNASPPIHPTDRDRDADPSSSTSTSTVAKTPPRPSLALRLAAQSADRTRRILAPAWPVLAAPAALLLAILSVLVRPLARYMPRLARAVARLRAGWALF